LRPNPQSKLTFVPFHLMFPQTVRNSVRFAKGDAFALDYYPIVPFRTSICADPWLEFDEPSFSRMRTGRETL
jgi:hypothetical protein